MTDLAGPAVDLLWRNALGVIPLALLVALITRWVPCRPGTRHALWAVVLLWLVLPPVLPSWRVPVQDSLTGETIVEPTAPSVGGVGSLAPSNGTSDMLPLPVRRPSLSEVIVENANDIAHPVVARRPDAAARATSKIPFVSAPGMMSSDDHLSTANLVEFAPQPVLSAEDVAPVATAGAVSGAEVTWKRWLADVCDVRDAIGRVSPIPTSIWLGGATLLFVLHAGRTLRLRRRLAISQPAPASVCRVVATAGRALGMRSLPEVVMVGDRLSPMVWLGRRRVLVLPAELWAELDPIGRQTVVTHELAHLRRRDHWVGWLDLIAGCAYWWHPVVWWVRSRVRAEAETCCDAWVVWSLPRGRRAYAEALLTARRFVSEEPDAVPALGIGVARRTARQFARRLTMVMTNGQAPKLSMTGLVLALLVATVGWMATPAESAPPAPSAPTVVVGPSVAAPPARPAHVHPREAGAAGAAGCAHSADVPPLEERMAKLELRLERLSQILERGNVPTPPTAQGWAGAWGSSCTTPFPAPSMLGGTYFAVPGAAAGPRAMALTDFTRAVEGKPVKKTYSLPEGKLEALTALMVRPDVPIRVAAQDDGLLVIATEGQHRVFQAFVDMLDPDGASARAPRSVTEYYRSAGKSAPRVDREAWREQRDRFREQARESRERASQLEVNVQRLHSESMKLEQEAEELERKADRVRHGADELRQLVELVDGGERNKLRQQIAKLEMVAEKLDGAVERIRGEAEGLHDKIEATEGEAAEWEEAAEDLDETAEDLAEDVG